MTQTTYGYPDATDRGLALNVFSSKRDCSPDLKGGLGLLLDNHNASNVRNFNIRIVYGQIPLFDTKRFRELVRQWKMERGPLSSARKMAQHPAYLEIIKMGKNAIPFLLAELEREPDHWFLALHSIVGVNPISEENRGKIGEMAQDWINWGRDQGYSWDNI